MLVVSRDCPVCDAGLIGFVMADDGQTIFVQCDECFSVWTGPDQIKIAPADAIQPPDYLLPGTTIIRYGKNSHYATWTEVVNAGLEKYVIAEETPQGE